MKEIFPDDDPLWYKDAIIYELHIKAFHDSNGDGIGDFRGLLEKLDYLEGLGVTAIWLLPFYPSPLRDDGYDISDYFNVHSDYGSVRDFKEFLRAARRRGIRVITELVLNHTSNESQWFKRSRSAKQGSPWRNMYVWSDTPERYRDARIIFKDFETSNWRWDPEAQAYYWHRFYSHQPDLNFDNPQVHKTMLRAIDFWLEMGVDGLRLDAVPYLYEREGTHCENLPETHAFLKKLRAHIDGRHSRKMLLAEANQWPEDAAAYFGAGDECHMAFHFPLMPRMFMAIQMEDNFPIIDILNATPAVPDSCQWAIFLRNHDELTLEMVTDEERDYMYRTYARDPRAKINLGIRRRLAPLLGNNRKKIELMNILFFSFPGTPVIYYGDEIGMGDNYYLGDRDGVRTPMQWSPDRNAGFSRANPQQLYLPVIIDPEYHYEAVNVENHERNLSSLLWWMKRVIGMRKRFKAFSRGNLTLLSSSNPKVLAFSRQYQDEIILVLINLSRFSQVLELDLARYAGYVPEEVFSGNSFPPIKKDPYILTFGPYSHYWLALQKERESISVSAAPSIPEMNVTGEWETVLASRQRESFEALVLPRYLTSCRWFGSKARTILKVRVIEDVRFTEAPRPSHLLVLEVSYNQGAPELYLLPVTFALRREFARTAKEFPRAVIAYLVRNKEQGVIYDSIYDKTFRAEVLAAIANRKKMRGAAGELLFYPDKKFKNHIAINGETLPSQPIKAEQSNTSIIYGDRLYLKLYRRLDEGVNPDQEIIQALSERARFAHIPPFAGAIEYRRGKAAPITIGHLQGFVGNVGDAWQHTLNAVSQYFEQVLSRRTELQQVPHEYPSLLDMDGAHVPALMQELIGSMFLDLTSLLGKRTAELHAALGSLTDDERFAPEPFSLLYQKSLYQSVYSLMRRTSRQLEKKMPGTPEAIRSEIEKIRGSEETMVGLLQKILQKKISAMKIRIHGDYHLGQVLYTGKDFVIIDFEGEPARTLSERKVKQSPLKDVAGMLRSFHYAVYAALFLNKSIRPEDMALFEKWIEPWYRYVSGIYLHAYRETAAGASFVPAERDELEILLEFFLLEKAVYELGYELNNRPDWLIIPIKGIQSIFSNLI